MNNNSSYRPWWWWINPWLYIQRRDRAYNDALDSLQEMSIEQHNSKPNKPWVMPKVNDDDVWTARLIVNSVYERMLDKDATISSSVPYVADLLAKLREQAYTKGLEQHSPIALNVGFEAGLVAGRDLERNGR